MTTGVNWKNKKLWIVGLVVLGAVIRFMISTNNSKTPIKTDQSKPHSVSVEKIILEEKDVTLEFSGHIEAKNSVKLMAQTDGIIKKIRLHQGMRVKKGEVIMELEERDKNTEFNRAQKLVEQNQLLLDNNKKLLKNGYATRIDNAKAQTALDDALNQLERAKNNLDFTKITSPIDGYLDRLDVKEGDYINSPFAPTAIANIVGDDNFIIVFSIPQTKNHQIFVNQKASAKIDNKKLKGLVDFVSNVAEIGTRTYYGEIKLENFSKEILLKMIGAPIQVKIAIGKTKAIKLKDSATYIDDNGNLNIKIVDENNKVSSIPVNILDSENTGITWFSSNKLSELSEVKVITRGAGFLNDGDIVNSVNLGE